MRSMLRKRKAVSPVIAALLLIAISVAASVLTYGWIMTMVGSQSKQSQTAMRIEIVEFYYTNSNPDVMGIKVALRNTGTTDAFIATFYLYDGNTLVFKKDEANAAMPPGTLVDFGFSNSTWTEADWGVKPGKLFELTIFNVDLQNVHAYLVKCVTDTGFTAEGTYTTSSSLVPP